MKSSNLFEILISLALCKTILAASIFDTTTTTDPSSTDTVGLGEPLAETENPVVTEDQCNLKLDACQALLRAEFTNGTVDPIVTCWAENATLTCLNDLLSHCPRTGEIEVYAIAQLSTLNKGFVTLCKDDDSTSLEVDEIGTTWRCMTQLLIPIELCTTLHTTKLFGGQPNPKFCCDYLEFSKCVQNEAPRLNCKQPVLQLVSKVFKVLHDGRSHQLAGSVQSCEDDKSFDAC